MLEMWFSLFCPFKKKLKKGSILLGETDGSRKYLNNVDSFSFGISRLLNKVQNWADEYVQAKAEIEEMKNFN